MSVSTAAAAPHHAHTHPHAPTRQHARQIPHARRLPAVPSALHVPRSPRSPPLHTSTLLSSTHALIALGELPATSTTPATPILSKTYLRHDIARHGLAAAVQAERTALVRLLPRAQRSHRVPRLLSATVSPTAVTLTMQRVAGAPAAQLSRPQPRARAARLVRGVVAALADVHAEGVTHADVTLRNVLVVPAGADDDDGASSNERVVLVDFGAAFVSGMRARDASHGTSAHVLAPELLDGAAADPAADVWAVGVFAWALLLGGAGPFDDRDGGEPGALRRVQHYADGLLELGAEFDAAWTAARAADGGVGDDEMTDARDFVLTCLSVDPSKRFTTAASATELARTPWEGMIDYTRIYAHPFLAGLD